MVVKFSLVFVVKLIIIEFFFIDSIIFLLNKIGVFLFNNIRGKKDKLYYKILYFNYYSSF